MAKVNKNEGDNITLTHDDEARSLINIHNDSIQSSDRLNRLVYARAISQEIVEAQPPMTIGILAKWGSGKTQLLNQIKDICEEQKQQDLLDEKKKKKEKNVFLKFIKKFWVRIILKVLFLMIITVVAIFATLSVVNPCLIIPSGNNSTEPNQPCNTSPEQHGSGRDILQIVALVILLFLVASISVAIFGKHFYKCCFGPPILCYAAFTEIPQSKEETDKKYKRYIFVDFNAWEYAGSDNLWAAIVTKLATAIEKEFGVVTSRLFRLTAFKMKQKDAEENGGTQSNKNRCCGNCCCFNFLENLLCSENGRCFKFLKKLRCWHCFKFPKKRCFLSKSGWWILFVWLLVAVIVSSVTVTSDFILNVNRQNEVAPFVIQVVMWTPPAVGIIYVIVKFLLSVCESNTSRIKTALKGTKTNMAKELGFMHKVKYEVQLMTEIVKCAEFLFNRKYRVFISIDDLDRVDLDKVKSVLDAVNILLSDQNSPFVCLIAIDSRIAVKSVEENMSSSLLQSNVTGHEYLKKIINLPFCLPEINDEEKKKFIHGMLAWTDEKVKKKENDSRPDTDPSSNPGFSTNSATNSESHKQTDFGIPDEFKLLNIKEFIEECQKFLYNDPTTLSYLNGNPRSIKRIFNILSLTLRVIECQREAEGAKLTTNESIDESVDDHDQTSDNARDQISRDLTTWVVLTDQWPYHVSYILHAIEKDQNDHESKIKESDHLLDIYKEHVREDLLYLAQANNKDETLSKEALIRDRNQDDFPKYLKKLKDGNETNLNKKKVNFLKRITINLDQSYMEVVQSHSNLVSIKRNLQEKQTNSEKQ